MNLWRKLTGKWLNTNPDDIYKIDRLKVDQDALLGDVFLQNNAVNFVDREQQKAKDDKSDKEMWVPSDLESD